MSHIYVTHTSKNCPTDYPRGDGQCGITSVMIGVWASNFKVFQIRDTVLLWSDHLHVWIIEPCNYIQLLKEFWAQMHEEVDTIRKVSLSVPWENSHFRTNRNTMHYYVLGTTLPETLGEKITNIEGRHVTFNENVVTLSVKNETWQLRTHLSQMTYQ